MLDTAWCLVSKPLKDLAQGGFPLPIIVFVPEYMYRGGCIVARAFTESVGDVRVLMSQNQPLCILMNVMGCCGKSVEWLSETMSKTIGADVSASELMSIFIFILLRPLYMRTPFGLMWEYGRGPHATSRICFYRFRRVPNDEEWGMSSRRTITSRPGQVGHTAPSYPPCE